ncbi:fimbrial biogenesis chaperone [[Pseudomonas] boreopolis]|uniref:fimbrial biogenesis chaperone n=1 Tax=Xanthomonas boreopolis TaxID=86183 RepID=UPI003DA0C0F2
MLFLLCVAGAGRADLGVENTRLVHHAGDAFSTLRIWNNGESASLIQAWIDDGDPQAKLEQLRLPLGVFPPMFRMDAGSNRDITVKPIQADGQALPTDRESLYWLNVLEVPSRQTSVAHGHFEHAVRWRLKLFYRPAGLAGKPDRAVDSLAWAFETRGDGQMVLRARNPTPYHVSLAVLTIAGKALELDPAKALVRPYSDWSVPVDAQWAASAGTPTGSLRIEWIGDNGKSQITQADVGR